MLKKKRKTKTKLVFERLDLFFIAIITLLGQQIPLSSHELYLVYCFFCSCCFFIIILFCCCNVVFFF